MFLASLVAFAILVRPVLDYYLVHVLPFGDILLAVCVMQLVTPSNAGRNVLRPIDKVILGLGSVFLVVSLVLSIQPILSTPVAGEAESVAGILRRDVPAGKVIVGPQTYWFGLPDRQFRSWEWVSYLRHFKGDTFEEAIHAFEPDVLIIDESVRLFYCVQTAEWTRFGVSDLRTHRCWQKSETDAFLAQHGRLIDRIETRAYGLVEIYAIS